MPNSELPLEKFSALDRLGSRYGFICRIPGVELSNDKWTVLQNLDAIHRRTRTSLGLGDRFFATAKQVHGDQLAIIDSPLTTDGCFEGCDGLVTDQPDVCLGIYVADCCAIYLVDRKNRAIGLVHSGKKGTELAIAAKTIAAMKKNFAVSPKDIVVQLSPCIRPPHYEVDFASEIVRQCREAGANEVYDCGTCTACDLNRYYSYRAEKGKTGRMLALLAL